jgi:hypothetical protein
MSRPLASARAWMMGLIAAIVLVCVPAVVDAAGMGFRNDSIYPVYVQGSFVVNGQVRRGPLIYLRPGQTAWDVNLPVGPRTISVFSVNNVKLYQDTLLFNGNDVYFAINPVMVPNGQPPRVELKELPPPKMNN